MRNYEQPESDCPEVIINKPDLQEHKEVIIRQGAVIEDLQEQLAESSFTQVWRSPRWHETK
jgi:hypothetical protein